MSSPVVKCLYKNALLLLNYFADLHPVTNRSTIAVVGALATGLVASVQIHHVSNIRDQILEVEKGLDQILRVEKDLESIKDEMTAIKEEMVTKEDLKNFVNEIARQNPCLENAESIFPRYPK